MMCRGETRSLRGVVEVSILRLCLPRGLDARGCRLLRRHGVMPWCRRGSYATIEVPSVPQVICTKLACVVSITCRLRYICLTSRVTNLTNLQGIDVSRNGGSYHDSHLEAIAFHLSRNKRSHGVVLLARFDS